MDIDSMVEYLFFAPSGFFTFRPFMQQYIDHAHAVMDGEVGTKLKKS
ncbi:MAG: hypothetical protein SPH77_08020 [Campylobacter sp.]|nr:hypothetical protein [Campylobacter sp.]MCI6565507.1 hypothetical protein [Campylobacter sp.]MCI6579451.1 hypothetical protein [Campylobacter sp.]MCI7014238.1 hypothetical protein [Campylobacter sp.]MDY6188760.1 hypothetical protein [Campylobacter sp.]